MSCGPVDRLRGWRGTRGRGAATTKIQSLDTRLNVYSQNSPFASRTVWLARLIDPYSKGTIMRKF
jgi:hypothetical protein